MSWDEEELAELESLRDGDDPASCFGAGVPLVCRCHSVEEREIDALVGAGCGLDEIARRTGAGTACGSCRPQLEGIVAAGRRV